MDRGIGRIVKALKETGRLDNTLLIFLADNGGCAEEITKGWRKWIVGSPVGMARTRAGVPVRYGNDPMVMPGGEDTYQSYGIPWANVSNTPFRLYKHWVHEGGIATPLIVHWPDRVKAKNELRHQAGHLIDIMATCVDVSGAKYPHEHNGEKILPMEGKSLVPAFDDKPIEREALYWEHEDNRAMRVGKWKLVAKGEKGPWELYDVEADRTEMHDVAGKYPERVKKMVATWQAWAVRTNVYPNRKSTEVVGPVDGDEG
jgi:arylsulfatase